MPPIAGVAQGAMVLRDAVLPDLSYSQLRETLAPKVDGSLHLDELFSDNRLEFFIFFSSLAYVAGNPGQSAYSAANAFMASLAARRRKRGLVASVINMGGIVGEGYISRQLALGKQSALIKAGFDFQSEQAFHELFSEAVLAGRLGSEDSLEISSGLRVGEVRGVSFANNPIFQHQVFKTKTDPTIRGIRPRHNDVMKALHNARTDEEALDIIKDGVLTKFEAVLRVKLERSSGMHLSPDQLGIDSLVAVEFQSWLAKDLGVDLSVMKILNFISIGDLIRAVKDTLAPDKIPKLNLVVDGSENEASEHAQAHGTDPSFNEGTIAIIGSPSALDSSEADIVTPLSEPEILVDGSTPPTVILENPSLSTISNESFLRISSNMKFERSAPMSFAQTRFWFLKFAVENQAAFNVTTVVQLCGSLDYARFSRALVAVGQRHEAVRTAFYVDDATKEPMQGVLPHSRLHLEREIAAGNDQVEDAIQEMRRHHFDLSAGQSVRLKLVTLPKDRHVLILGYHHIALDGIGNQIFFSDLESAYNGTLDTAGADILQYPDYTLKQLQHFKRGDWQEDLQYWLDRFAVLPPSLPLMSLSRKPTRPETTQYASNSIKLHLDAITKAQVHECSHRLGVLPFHFYLTVFGVLLARQTDFRSDDICVGIADSNRKDVSILRSLGLFLNLLPIHFRQRREHSFVDLLRDVKHTTDAAFAHSRIPIDVLLSKLNVPRSRSHSPLFQAFFNYQQFKSGAQTLCGCKASGELVSGGETGYD
ncbi:putative acyl transferase acyl hydrolase lysophospholipase [Rosellinia necatrix]|uniref:Putative acyl transferase acyl hydrolase lysophospholipase n=1 Tax=Rosellinia necatrix TaxID=77044 RepID=A0A1S8A5I9_ROSNE|nr:putative acyl transferase acyl hydrolase lysophospholipase [Rosellinia necatrix]